jgi:hypothetical protein
LVLTAACDCCFFARRTSYVRGIRLDLGGGNSTGSSENRAAVFLDSQLESRSVVSQLTKLTDGPCAS